MSAVGLLTITLLSAAFAAVMTVIAWRVARDERRRADARIAALAAEIHGESPQAAAPPVARPRVVAVDDLPLRHVASSSAPAREPIRGVPALSGSRYGAVAAIGLFAVASIVAVVVWLSSGPRTPTAPAGPVTVAHAADPQVLPLELTALAHDRDGDRLTVRGVVRNPASAAALDRTDAVVSVFNRAGEFVMSGRVRLRQGLGGQAASQESTFVVVIPNVTDVGRYRVSFRTEERVVPHVDKRETGMVARLRDGAATARQAQ